MYKKGLKRLLDFVFSALGLIMLSPLFLLIIIALLITIKTNPFFFQLRPGKNGKIFKLVKFKSMTSAVDIEGNLLPNKERLFPFGIWLRKTSLDELPQLLNVLKGDMSVVGPRPLLVEYLPLYNEDEMRRHEVLPGITGWAQVNGRNAITWQEKFQYDVWYVDHISFSLDLKIIWKTLQKVVNASDVNATDEVSMEKFTGTTDAKSTL